MARVIDIVTAVVALGFAALGAKRGLFRELMVLLGGVVLGAMMGSLWGEFWAGELARYMATGEQTLQGAVLMALLFGVVLFVGYGSGFLLSRTPLPVWQRVVGGLLGLLNGLLLEAFFFRYLRTYFLKSPSVFDQSIASTLLTQWLSWVFLGLVVAFALVVTVVALVRFARWIARLTQAPVPAAPSAAAPATPAPPATESPTVPCPSCGNPLVPGATYCPHCGKLLSP
ncbi:MAG: CvpA family protein [Chloroflexia bacterium]